MDVRTDPLPALKDVSEAAQRIAGFVMNTPCVVSHTLSRLGGCELHLKFENLQFTASFKERGALNKLLTLDADARRNGVCAMSAGNHAQGVAYHASRLGIPATIVMPLGTPLTKITRTREHGAKVIVHGANLNEALIDAQDRARAGGLTFVHPYDDPLIISGQGTLGLEVLDQVNGLDVIVVPIGGGGLISGIATAVKALRPEIEVIGVQSATYPSMIRALQDIDTLCPDGVTIAEGIAVKAAGALTRRIVRAMVDDILEVDESAIEGAIALLQSIEKTVVEGAGAAGMAAILAHPERFADKRVATILTGGNIDSRMLASVIMRDLVRSGRLMRIAVPISDQPGALAKLATMLGEHGANIVEVAHERLGLSLNPRGAILDVMLELQDIAHGEQVIGALHAAGFNATRREAA